MTVSARASKYSVGRVLSITVAHTLNKKVTQLTYLNINLIRIDLWIIKKYEIDNINCIEITVVVTKECKYIKN